MKIEDLSPGMRVMLDDDTPGIVLGPGGFRSEEIIQNTVINGEAVCKQIFHPITSYIIAWWYKTEWHLADILTSLSDFPLENWKEGWSDKVLSAVLNRQNYC